MRRVGTDLPQTSHWTIPKQHARGGVTNAAEAESLARFAQSTFAVDLVRCSDRDHHKWSRGQSCILMSLPRVASRYLVGANVWNWFTESRAALSRFVVFAQLYSLKHYLYQIGRPADTIVQGQYFFTATGQN